MFRIVSLNIVQKLLFLSVLLIVAACSTTGKAVLSTVEGYTATVTVTVGGVAPETIIGAADVSLTVPQGVSVKAQKTGLIENGVINSPMESSRLFLTGKFTDNLLRVAMISPEGFKAGEVLRIKIDVNKGVELKPDSIAVKSFQLVDLKGNTLTGATVKAGLLH